MNWRSVSRYGSWKLANTPDDDERAYQDLLSVMGQLGVIEDPFAASG